MPNGAVVTLATDRPGGFSDEDVAAVVELMPGFGGAVRIGSNLSAIRTVLDTYLGRDVGRRILNGEIRRGSVETISAAIVFGDLRGFTALSDEIPREQLIAMLDDYLGCLVIPIEARGGQVLKFLGDGLLATFALGDSDPSLLCEDALGGGGRGPGAHREGERAARGRRTAGHDPGCRLASGRCALRQCRLGPPPRFHRHRPGGERGEPPGSALLAPGRTAHRQPDDSSMPTARAARFRCLGERQLRGVRNPVEVFTLA